MLEEVLQMFEEPVWVLEKNCAWCLKVVKVIGKVVQELEEFVQVLLVVVQAFEKVLHVLEEVLQVLQKGGTAA